MFKNIFGEKLGAVFAILAIAFYTFLVGADAAVVRAALMGSISLLARQLGRRNAGMNALAIVALVMAVINPLVLWDVGFQLSFFATLGLILYAEPFSNFTGNLISKITRNDNSTLTRIINEQRDPDIRRTDQPPFRSWLIISNASPSFRSSPIRSSFLYNPQ